jgi:hypothetical protein
MKRQNPYNWEMQVHCSGERHIVRYKDGKLQFPNHGTSFKQFKTLWSMAGGQECGCMVAVQGYRKLANHWRLGVGQHASASIYMHGAATTAGMTAWTRISTMFNFATVQDRKTFSGLVPGPEEKGIENLRNKLQAQRMSALGEAVSRFNEQADRHMASRTLNLSKGTVSEEYCTEVFSELNLRGHSVGFKISLPAWAKMVRAFGRSSVPSHGGLGDNHQLLLNARVVGMTAEGNLVTRFWALSVTGYKNPSIITVDRITSVLPEEGIQHSWSNVLTKTDLTAKNLQKVYYNG